MIKFISDVAAYKKHVSVCNVMYSFQWFIVTGTFDLGFYGIYFAENTVVPLIRESLNLQEQKNCLNILLCLL